MLDTKERIALACKFSTQANKVWCSANRELLAAFSLPDLWKSLGAWLQLEARADVENTEPSVEAYKAIISRGFLVLLDEGVVSPAAPITKLGQQALDEMRRASGIGVESLPAPVVELTPEQTLDEQIVVDWNTLSSAQIRKKRDSSKTYAAALSRLLETDRLSPHAVVKTAY
jgi:hypothetical protein